MVGLLCLVLFSFLLSPAWGSVGGSAEWGYFNSGAEEDGKTVSEQSSFTQKYTINFSKSGYIKDRRFGRYDLGLGYQWTAVNTDIDAEGYQKDLDISAGKLLYRGEILIAPGALPVRLHAFSFDQSDTSFIMSPQSSLFFKDSPVIDLISGQRITTGFTLITGIRNGSSLGIYREEISKYPGLFIDFREHYVRDVHSPTPENSRFRDLAFVSLNKKDNWFHYRYKEFTDFDDETNDFAQKTYTLGTIDHHLRRQWINLTNWIEISVDGSLIDTEGSRIQDGSEEKSELYLLNLFSRMAYGKNQLDSFSYIKREKEDQRLEIEYEIPLYGSGWLSPDISWRSSFLRYYEEEKDLLSGESDLGEEGEFLRGMLTMGNRAPLKVSPALDLETKRTAERDGYGVRARLEMRTNDLYQSSTYFVLGYTATYVNGETLQQPDVDYLEHELYGAGEIVLNPNHVLQGRQEFLYGSGKLDTNVNRYIIPKGSSGLLFERNEYKNLSGSVFRSTTSLALESVFGRRLRNVLSLTFDSQYLEGERRYQANVLNELRYSRPTLRGNMTSSLLFGDAIEPRGFLYLSGAPSAGLKGSNFIAEHSMNLVYAPNQRFKSEIRFNLSWNDNDQGDSLISQLNGRTTYSFFSHSGYQRKLAQIYQDLAYEYIKGEDFSLKIIEYRLGGSYYPTRIFELGGELSYYDSDYELYNSIALEAYAALRFSKLICEARYSYGVGEFDSGTFDERKEHIFQAKVRKIF